MSKELKIPDEELKLIVSMNDQYLHLLKHHSQTRRSFLQTEHAILEKLGELEVNFKKFANVVASELGILEDDLANWSMDIGAGCYQFLGEEEALEEIAEETPAVETVKTPEPTSTPSEVATKRIKELLKKANKK